MDLRGLIIARIITYTGEGGQHLKEDFGIAVDELPTVADNKLLDLFEKVLARGYQ